MEISSAKFIKESYDNEINNIRDILESLELCEFNTYIKDLFNEIISEIEQRTYTLKESRKILTTLFYSLTIIKDNLDKKIYIKNDNLFSKNDNEKYLGEELIEGIVISSKNEHEEKKIKYYGYLFGNILFQSNFDRDECNRLIRLSRTLSYCQIKLINMYMISQTIQVPILHREDYTKIGIRDYKLLGILQDTLEMIQKGILNSSGKLVLDVVQINPSKIKVQGTGILLYNNMSINKMPYDELEDLLDLLSKKS